MKILHVINSLEIGGAEKLVADLLPIIKNKGHKVDLLLFNGVETSLKKELIANKINIIEFTKNGSMYNPIYILQLIFIMSKYDIVHTHNSSPQLFCSIAQMFCSNKLITTEHNTYNRRRNWKWYKFIDKWMYRRYDKIICISDIAEILLRKYLNNDSSKICTIYNGVNIDLFINADADESLYQNNDICKIMMIAGFRPQKDQPTLIKAISLLPPHYHLFLVGDGTEKSKCVLLAKELNIEDRVHFLGIRSNIPQLLKAADVIVMSSHYEGLSLSCIEGMASGKPFIASDVDGLREVTKDAGILFEHQNCKQLADEIKKVTTDNLYCKLIVERCQRKAKLYDINKMADGYLNTYIEVKRDLVSS